MADTIHRTLIIRFSSVGDIVLSSLLLRAFHARFPECRIDYLIKEEYTDLVRFNPYVSNVIALSSTGGLHELQQIKQNITKARYDLVVDIHDSLRSRYLCLGLPNVVRVRKRKFARFMLVKTRWDVYECFGGSPGVAERYLETVEKLGVTNDGKGLEMHVPEIASENAKSIVHEAGIKDGSAIIGVCPSAKHWNKMWLKERFAEVASSLARENDAAVMLFGSGGNEEVRCREITSLIAQASPTINVLNLAGKLSLLETTAMMDHCSIIISNDSGLLHTAAARKRKVVAIFGPTVKELGFFPYGTTDIVIENPSLTCRPCTHIGLPYCPKGHFKCMVDVEAAQVIDAARGLLKTPAVQ